MAGGIFSWLPMVNIEVTLYDGSFHDVDSSEMAFKLAASMGFKQGCKTAAAQPVILEPIMKVEIETSLKITWEMLSVTLTKEEDK